MLNDPHPLHADLMSYRDEKADRRQARKLSAGLVVLAAAVLIVGVGQALTPAVDAPSAVSSPFAHFPH